jgi:K+-transporting ATPase KdpF subunit
VRVETVTVENLLGLIVGVALAGYLLVALRHADRF